MAIGYGGKIYSGAGQTLTLSYTGTVPAGYTFEGFSVNGSAIDGNSFTMPTKNVTVGTILTKNELTLADNSSNDEAIAAAAASAVAMLNDVFLPVKSNPPARWRGIAETAPTPFRSWQGSQARS
jgi:hypothetical protein